VSVSEVGVSKVVARHTADDPEDHVDIRTHAHTHTLSLSHSLSLSHTHTPDDPEDHVDIRTHAHTLSFTHTHSLSLSLSHTPNDPEDLFLREDQHVCVCVCLWSTVDHFDMFLIMSTCVHYSTYERECVCV